MRVRVLPIPVALVATLGLLSPSAAQDAPQPPGQYDVLTRGPVHEAYAGPVDYNPEPGPVATKAPPEPIEELPPEQKPQGDDVEWVPGYWAWDSEATEYFWVSGFWRDMPPGRRWVPGTWQEAADGYHWTPGFWAAEDQEAIEYVPPPPRNIDAGPSTAPAHETDIYVPGCWIWYQTRFVWRPGYWVEYHPEWVWVPARYVWTPGGCIFVEGYWDHPLHMRGLLFAPIRLAPGLVPATFVYRPTYVVQPDFLMTALFVGPARRHYYFGDYFEPVYQRSGFVAWFNYQPARRALDPTFGYYRAAYHNQPAWGQSLAALYQARFSGEVARPPRTLVQQNTAINNIVNNNITNVNVTKNFNITNVQNVRVVQPITQVNKTEVTALATLAPQAGKGARPATPRQVVNLTQVNESEINQAKERRQMAHRIARRRQEVEAQLLTDGARGDEPGRPRRTARLELPKSARQAEPGSPARKDRQPPSKNDRPDDPGAELPKRLRPPAPPALPKGIDRQPPKDDGRELPRRVQPPGRKGRPDLPGKKDFDPPVRPKDRPMPKKDRDDEPRPKRPFPPMKERDDDPMPKRPQPKKDRDDEPQPGRPFPPAKDRDDDPMPKRPQPKKDRDDDPPPVRPRPKLDRDDDMPPQKSPSPRPKVNPPQPPMPKEPPPRPKVDDPQPPMPEGPPPRPKLNPPQPPMPKGPPPMPKGPPPKKGDGKDR